MDGTGISITPTRLYERLGTASAPILLDVRRTADIGPADRIIVAARRRDPDDIARWARDLPAGRSVVVYCVHGHQVSQNAAAALCAAGVDAVFLDGGIAGWSEAGLPTRRFVAATPGKWVTRERPKIDRIACPWLIRRFIDPDAEFLYVPAVQVRVVASETGATPYDIPDVEFGHVGERCSFDAIVRVYDIHDPAIDRLATIVRGSDTSRPDLAPQCPGLSAISHGLSANFTDDHEQLGHGMVIYDALYTWCRTRQADVGTAAATRSVA